MFIPGSGDEPPAIEWRGINPAALPSALPDIEASTDLTDGSWFGIMARSWQEPYPRPPAFLPAADGTLTLSAPLQGEYLPSGAPRLFLRGTVAPPVEP